MSTAVPNVEIVLKNAQLGAARVEPQRDRDAGLVGGERRLAAGVGDQLVLQGGEAFVARDGDLAAQPVEQVRAPLGQVADVRRHALGVQRDAQRVGGRLEQVRRDHAR